MTKQIEWCIEQHRNTNHMYDTYLPYEFHLRMVAAVGEKFKDLILIGKDINPVTFLTKSDVILACWGHDLIEDTRVSYNDVKIQLGEYAADLVYAVTNEKGRNRSERANDKYYEGIRNLPNAAFVKLCDRIANVQYSKMTKSGMFEKYKRENTNFFTQLGYSAEHHCFPMFEYLRNLFENESI